VQQRERTSSGLGQFVGRRQMAAEEQVLAKQIRTDNLQILKSAGGFGSEAPVMVGQRASGAARLRRQLQRLPAQEAGLFPEQTPAEIPSGEAGLVASDQHVETFGHSGEIFFQQERRREAVN
jgi:hypothetical protein